MPKIVYNGSAYRMYGDLPAIGARAPDVSLVFVSDWPRGRSVRAAVSLTE